MHTKEIKKLISLLLVAGILLFSSACSKQESPDATAQTQMSEKSQANSEFENAYLEADKLRQQAAELEYEWSNTESFLLDAKKEFADGNQDKAMHLVEQARQEAELAIQQAKTEAKAWKARVIK
ncbi:MAG: hypothetical protein KJO88_01420 [Gammaproteobacteria bacterium]|nr:hypothetical protein [Gammaproteobacteria bacterium]